MTMTELRSQCLQCKKCALWEGRTNVVFGGGNETSGIMLVGEGPGASEDRLGEPFVGRSGKLLDDMLELIGLHRSMLFIGNIVKCRPPGNRDPLNTEMAACRGWLDAQIELIKPKIIVCLGRIAAKALIDEKFKITLDHGQWTVRDGIHYMALYHPALLLRDPSRRPETFVDLKALQSKIREICPNIL